MKSLQLQPFGIAYTKFVLGSQIKNIYSTRIKIKNIPDKAGEEGNDNID